MSDNEPMAARMNPAELLPRTVIRWRNDADRTLSHRKDDGTGWWLTDGSGLVDTAWHSGDWRVIRGPSVEWVVGFLIDNDAEMVVLIRKAHPEWQAGKLNGVGGKVEHGEGLRDAMVREFREETGVLWIDRDRAIPIDWRPFATLVWEEGLVHFFRAFAPMATLKQCRTMTDESIERHRICTLNEPGVGPACVIPNLLWLVPLAAHRHDTYEVINVVETGTTLRKVGRAGAPLSAAEREGFGPK